MDETHSQALTGSILEIQRFSIHDGPGIRTTVFLKGCPLQCVWCHNPEAIDAGPLLSFQPGKCIGCGYCFNVCPNGAHQMVDEKHVLNRNLCTTCGLCAKECWATALETVGRPVTVKEVVDEVHRDQPFYKTSGGGMTVSGGEPMMQIEFTEALLREARHRGLDCCVETCGYAPFESFERIVPHTNLFLYDLKDTNDARHKEFTGISNELIIRNLKRLHDDGAKITLRLPMIPGCNDRSDHFEGIASLLGDLPNIANVEILPYHPLGQGKLERFNLPSRANLPSKATDKQQVSQWVAQLKRLGIDAGFY